MKLNNKKKWIAVTGGIGVGKSQVSTRLRENGCYVISTDEIVAKLYEKRNVRLKLMYMFPEAFDSKKVIDKSKISQIVFADGKRLKELNDFFHPMVFTVINDMSETIKEQTIFVEAPVLFEGGNEKLFDKVIVVKRPLDERIKSVKERSGLTEEEVLARINGQVDYDSLDLTGRILINNDQTLDVLKIKTDIVYEILSHEFPL